MLISYIKLENGYKKSTRLDCLKILRKTGRAEVKIIVDSGTGSRQVRINWDVIAWKKGMFKPHSRV